MKRLAKYFRRLYLEHEVRVAQRQIDELEEFKRQYDRYLDAAVRSSAANRAALWYLDHDPAERAADGKSWGGRRG